MEAVETASFFDGTSGAYHLNKSHARKSSELFLAFPPRERPPAVDSSPD